MKIITSASLAVVIIVSCWPAKGIGQTPKSKGERDTMLEEVIVTAQRKEERLQDTPIAVSALSSSDMETQGIHSLLDLREGAIPTLKVTPFPNDRSVLQLGIRGLTQADVGQFTKEPTVGVYMDGVYLGRAQGLGMEMVDVQRIEVLRGPQGTLYGRNTVGGAVNFVTANPNPEEFTMDARLEMGRYDLRRAKINANVPLTSWLAARIGLAQSERDGWVDNPGGANWNSWDKWGGRIDIRAEPGEQLSLDLSYDRSSIDSTQVYYQFRRIEIEPGSGEPWADVALEPDRLDKNRFDVGLPNSPNETEVEGLMFTAQWDFHYRHLVKYIASQRELERQLSNNFGGVFLVGNSTDSDDSQNQVSHEIQFQGDLLDGGLDYTAGLFIYSEETDENQEQLISVLPVGQDGIPLLALAFPSAANLPVTLLPWSQRDQLSPQGQLVLNTILIPQQGTKRGLLRAANFRRVLGDVDSRAAYFQTTWTPPLLSNKLELTFGIRYTDDDKEYVRPFFNDQPDGVIKSFEGSNTSPTLTANYHWTDNFSIWAKWSNGWRSGGVNSRSATFLVYEADEVEMYELGWKSMLWDGRVRLNGALFSLTWENKQIDFSDPQNISISETINATLEDPVHHGAEIDLMVRPIPSVIVALDYQYLDVKETEQFNPVINENEVFPPITSPKHAASIRIGYQRALGWGVFDFNLSANWTTAQFWNSTDKTGGHEYALLNSNVGLSEIEIGNDLFSVNLWVKNLSDREWTQHQIKSQFSLAKAFGDPRTYGVSIKYSFL